MLRASVEEKGKIKIFTCALVLPIARCTRVISQALRGPSMVQQPQWFPTWPHQPMLAVTGGKGQTKRRRNKK